MTSVTGPAGRIPCLDGLRAVSISLVVAQHSWLSRSGGAGHDDPRWRFLNGALGVEIFFVISGYLITTLLVREAEARGRVSLRSFYVRRVLRIFPAYFAYLAVVVGLALGGLVPLSLGDLLSAVTFTWNYSPAATSWTLAHAWSLSVEEQFYLLWPATLLFLMRRKPRYFAPAAIVIAGLLSLYSNQWWLARPVQESGATWLQDARSTIYFLAPFRVFEFAIGGILAWVDFRKARISLLREILPVVGLR